jgi:hypothetical protein
MAAKVVYMVSIDGHKAPTVEHYTYESACMEAQRLAKLDGVGKVRILRMIAAFVPVTTHEFKAYE